MSIATYKNIQQILMINVMYLDRLHSCDVFKSKSEVNDIKCFTNCNISFQIHKT